MAPGQNWQRRNTGNCLVWVVAAVVAAGTPLAALVHQIVS